jgi:hypothetical protein
MFKICMRNSSSWEKCLGMATGKGGQNGIEVEAHTKLLETIWQLQGNSYIHVIQHPYKEHYWIKEEWTIYKYNKSEKANGETKLLPYITHSVRNNKMFWPPEESMVMMLFSGQFWIKSLANRVVEVRLRIGLRDLSGGCTCLEGPGFCFNCVINALWCEWICEWMLIY